MREWWDSIAQAFGYDFWAWGSAADWVGAIGTIGAFFFGFWLLWREIQKEARSLADSFATWIETADESDRTFVHAYNGASVPIVAAWVHDRHKIDSSSGPGQVLGQPTGNGYAIGASSSTSVALSGRGNARSGGLYVEFIDGRGRRWYRSLSTGKYLSARALGPR